MTLRPNVEAKAVSGFQHDYLELFEPNPGVLISDGGRIKEGPFEAAKFYDFMSLTCSNIRLTKQNYNMLTRTGNLSRSNLNKNKEENEEETISPFEIQGDTLKSQEEFATSRYNLQNSSAKKDFKGEYNKSFKSLQNTKSLANSIKLENSKNYEFLLQPAKESSTRLPKIQKMNSALHLDAISEQNLSILKNSSWGKESGANNRFSGDKISHSKPSRFSSLRSLGYIKKPPRIRDTGPPLKARLPPPRIGSSFGHGFKSKEIFHEEENEANNKTE